MLTLNKKFFSFATQRARYKIAYGGRAGSKSHTIASMLLLKGMERKHQIVGLREYQRSIDESVHRLLSNKIRDDDQLRNFYKVMSDRIIGINGTEFTYSGIKNAKNFKSFEGATIAWVEEAQTLSAESMMIFIPTIRTPGSEIWFSYNPDNSLDPVHQLMLDKFILTEEYLLKQGFEQEDIEETIKSYDVGQINLNINYYDNPFCPGIMKIEAKKMELADYELYRHVWLGECRMLSDAIIYKDKFEILDFEITEYQKNTNIPMFNGEFITMKYGLDFGWVHPTSIIQTFKYNNCIYVVDEIVGKEMDYDDITLRILSDFKWFNQYKDTIWADHEDPRMIEVLKRSRVSKFGDNLPALLVNPCVKGQNSVEAGITWLKTHQKIYVHPRCKNTIDNFRKYSYKKDKNDVIQPVIVKLNDDCLDALRYSYSDEIERGGGIDWTKISFA
jgi:phage terminase large subunit